MIRFGIEVGDGMAADGPKKLLTDESAATAIEYGLIAALIATVIIGAVGVVGSEVVGLFEKVETDVSTVTNGAS